MKYFWITLVVSIIAIFAILTWVQLHMSGSYGARMPGGYAAAAKHSPGQVMQKALPPGRIIFPHDEKDVTRDANVITIKGGESVVDKESWKDLYFENVGEGPLEITLEEVRCGCIHKVFVGKSPKDWHALEIKQGPPVVFAPKERGMVRVSWKPDKKQVPVGAAYQDQRFSFTLGTNDPIYFLLSMEVDTRIVPPKETE
jgi:hypothetical protein